MRSKGVRKGKEWKTTECKRDEEGVTAEDKIQESVNSHGNRECGKEKEEGEEEVQLIEQRKQEERQRG